MKKTILTLLLALGSSLSLVAENAEAKKPSQAEKAKAMEKHQKGTAKLSLEQDDLSADVQELIDEQTNPKVIELLAKVETLMAETVDELDDQNTGGGTIAIQTEIIEKIYEAAKEKSQ